MRINPTQKNIASHHKDTSKAYNPSLCSKQPQDKIAFSGLNLPTIKSGVRNGAAGMMDWVERTGFLAEFIIIDSISMIIPRALVGLRRDKEKTGKNNYKAAAEEFGREVTSGPSMMIIPLVIFWGLKKAIPSAKVPEKTMQDLSTTMQKVADNTLNPEIFKNKQEISKQFAGELFENAFGDTSKFAFDDKDALKAEFTKKLTAGTPKDKKVNAALAEDFEKLVVNINNKNTKEITQNTKGINIGGGTTAKELFSDFKHYSDDIIESFVKKDFAKETLETAKGQAKTFLKSIQKSRTIIRAATSAVSFSTIGAFLLYLPKLTQVSKISPAEESAKLAIAAAAKGGISESK